MGMAGRVFKPFARRGQIAAKLSDMLSLHRLLFIVLLVFGSAACDSAADRATTVEFWAMGQEGEQVKALLPDFERRHPGIRVRVQQIPWSAAHEKLLTAYAGDSMPDAFQLGNTWIPEFVALRAIEPSRWMSG